MASNPALPPAIAALPQEVRDAMGRALATEIVAALNRLAEQPVKGKEEVPQEKEKRPDRGDLSAGGSVAA